MEDYKHNKRLNKCASFVGKRTVLNSTALLEIQQKGEFTAIPEEQWDQSARDILLCAECCNTELCNIKGCGEEGEGYPCAIVNK
ncbi:hypothetical protein CHS0354_042418 [Potamilus streckersoni]|uniref:Uncharacterized protein n=1 Tax=Potamilus streckersoni TaxID=2493646 RepID=A0AAE0SU28_9BIVA|nr:hypothetical protein CHS0354_042418 [Potamilus streckersoni]